MLTFFLVQALSSRVGFYQIKDRRWECYAADVSSISPPSEQKKQKTKTQKYSLFSTKASRETTSSVLFAVVFLARELVVEAMNAHDRDTWNKWG